MRHVTLDSIAALARAGRINWRLASAFAEARAGRERSGCLFLREWEPR